MVSDGSLRMAPLYINLSWDVGIEVCAERVAWSWESWVVEGLGMGMLNLILRQSWSHSHSSPWALMQLLHNARETLARLDRKKDEW